MQVKMKERKRREDKLVTGRSLAFMILVCDNFRYFFWQSQNMPQRYSQLRWWKIFSGLHGFHPHNSLVWRHQGAFWWEVFLEVISNHVQNLWNNYNRTFPSFQYDAGKGASSKITQCRIKNLDNDGLSRIINLVARGEMTHCQILHFRRWVVCTKILNWRTPCCWKRVLWKYFSLIHQISSHNNSKGL